MTDFEKEYKRRFKDKEDLMGADADQIWSNVSQQIGSKKRGFRLGSLLYILLGLGFLGISSGSYLYFNSNRTAASDISMNHEIAETKTSVQNTEVVPGLIEEHDTTEEYQTQANVNDTAPITKDDLVGRNTTLTSQKPNKILYQPKLMEGHIVSGNLPQLQEKPNKADRIAPRTGTSQSTLNKIASRVNAGSSTDKTSIDQALHSAQSTNKFSTEVQEMKTELNDQNTDGTKIENLAIVEKSMSLEKVSLLSYSFPRSEASLNVSNTLESKYYQEKQSLLPYELSFVAGVNLFDNSFSTSNSSLSTDVASALNRSNKNDWGYGGSLQLSWKFKDHFRFSLGADYQELRTKFDRIEVRNISVEEEDRIIGIDTNMQGEQVPIYGSLFFDATQTHTVLHHNQYKVLSIPIQFGIEKRFNRITIGTDLGIAYSFILQQQGRTLNQEGELVYFGEVELPFKKSLLTYQMSPFFSYSLSDRIAIKAQGLIRHLPAENSDLHGVDRSAFIYSGMAGFSYRLK